MVPIRLHADPTEVRVTFGPYTLSPSEAVDFARELQRAANEARNLPSVHERHVDLLASCALCVREANGQFDRLTYDEPPTLVVNGELAPDYRLVPR